MPAAASTSASPSLAQVMPMAPAASCIWASMGDLCVLACGRRRTGLSRKKSAMRLMLASTASMSRHSAGVSRSALGVPMGERGMMCFSLMADG